MKAEQRRLHFNPDTVDYLAYEEVAKMEFFHRLNRGQKTSVTYTHRTVTQKAAVNAVKANPSVKQSPTAPAPEMEKPKQEPADRSLSGVREYKSSLLGYPLRPLLRPPHHPCPQDTAVLML